MRRLHFVFVLLGALIFLNVLSTAQITIEVQGGKVTQPQQSATPQPSKKLKNQDVIDMAALKLSDDVIIDKIHSTQAIDFDTSVAGLKLLKANNVSDAVVRVMINPHPMMAGTKPTNPYVGLGDGMYIVLAGKPIRIQPETYAIYSGQGKATGRIENSQSQLQVSNPLEFVVVQSKFGAGELFRLDEKNNHREFRLSPPATIDWRGKLEVRKLNNQISFDREVIDSHTYRIRLPHLSKGEYGFQYVESNDFVQDGSIQQYHICTFGVD